MAYFDQGRQANEKVGVLIGKMYLTLSTLGVVKTLLFTSY